jgi:hypothetical protein
MDTAAIVKHQSAELQAAVDAVLSIPQSGVVYAKLDGKQISIGREERKVDELTGQIVGLETEQVLFENNRLMDKKVFNKGDTILPGYKIKGNAIIRTDVPPDISLSLPKTSLAQLSSYIQIIGSEGFGLADLLTNITVIRINGSLGTYSQAVFAPGAILKKIEGQEQAIEVEVETAPPAPAPAAPAPEKKAEAPVEAAPAPEKVEAPAAVDVTNKAPTVPLEQW